MRGAYYNEHDTFAAAWLRELIKAGLIADGEVDERDIQNVSADDVRGFVQCHFFAGIGGWSYALRLAGWDDSRPVWTGSCPCQPFSAVGRGHGDQDARHLWPVWFSLIQQCKPPSVFGEQVATQPGLSWLDAVSLDLEGQSYAIAAVDLCAASVGAPHIRQRLFWVANTNGERLARPEPADRAESSRYATAEWRAITTAISDDDVAAWATRQSGQYEPLLFTGHDGLFAKVGRLRGYGNAIVPQVAQAFIEAYLDLEL